MIPFAAVLLAGGQSRRMGRDKALLRLADGRLLWERQLAVLRALEPAELFISGPARAGFPPDVPRLDDDPAGHGPLGGIATVLTAMRSPLAVVLAVDMPLMTTGCLAELLRLCDNVCGVIPRHRDTGFYEPLASVYPRQCGPLAVAKITGEHHSLQNFIRAAGSMLKGWDIPVEQTALFKNWNEPETANLY